MLPRGERGWSSLLGPGLAVALLCARGPVRAEPTPSPSAGGSTATPAPANGIEQRLSADALPRSLLPQDPDSVQAREDVRAGKADGLTRSHVERQLDRVELAGRNAPAVVVSGGISLGAYQAGFLAMAVRFWHVARRSAPERFDPMPRIWTGASAGAVNALLGGLGGCDHAYDEPEWEPERSLFWTVWVEELDLQKLLPVKDGGRTDHLFSEKHMQGTIEKIVTAAGSARFRPGCSFAFGITTTHLGGRNVSFGDERGDRPATLKRVTEKIAVQVLVDAEGKLSARLPYLAGRAGDVLPRLEVSASELLYYAALGRRPEGSGGQEVPMRSVFEAPRASGAFPLAFPPVPLALSVLHDGSWQDASPLALIDGGVLNNNPLDLAFRLGNRWKEAPGLGFEPLGQGNGLQTPFPVVYLDQDYVGWRWKRPESDGRAQTTGQDGASGDRRQTLRQTYLRHVPVLMGAARDAAVLDVLEHAPELSSLVKIPRRNAVLPSEFRFAMMGFADRQFRAHDFYRGMVDAIRFVREELGDTAAVRWVRPGALEARLGISSAGFRCVEEGACEGQPALASLRRASAKLTATARNGKLEPDRIEDLLVALGGEGYVYGDGIMGKGARASGTREDLKHLRARVGGAVQELLNNQSSAEVLVLRPVGMALLDEWLTYRPPVAAGVLGLSRDRGVSVGVEALVFAKEQRTPETSTREASFDRGEWRLGADVGYFGRRDAEQLDPGDVRFRATLRLRADWVSDLDGFGGAIRWLELGPYLRWRAGAGLTGAHLAGPSEYVLSPEFTLGLDLLELVGVRLSIPTGYWSGTSTRDMEHHRWRLRRVGITFDVLTTGW